MGEDQVDAAAVEVEGLAEVLHAHRRALDVPAGTPRSPGGLPGGLARLDRFPEAEVAHVLLAVLVARHPLPLARLLEVETGEGAVGGVAGDLEEDRAVGLVGV